MTSRLRNKVALIIGAATGLGRAAAQLFAREGATLTIADANIQGGEKTAGELGISFAPIDISDAAAVRRLIEGVVGRCGRLDVMVNVAGILQMGPLIAISDEEYRRVRAVNLDGMFYATREAARVMAPRKTGAIINVASVGGSFAAAEMVAYCASKAGVIGLTKAAAVELAPLGIRVNCVSPGTMLTGMGGYEVTPELRAQLDRLQPRPTAADPIEVANAILYLATDEASFVIGHDFIVDGGATAGRPGSAPEEADRAGREKT